MMPDVLFEKAITWLHECYQEFRFFQERDIVWTLQCRLLKEIERKGLPYKVFHGYPISRKPKHLVDLAIVRDKADLVAVTVDLKYEPSHARSDISAGKLSPSVVYWAHPSDGGVKKDVEWAQLIVKENLARTAYVVFVDEGSHFRKEAPFPGSDWLGWGQIGPGGSDVALLWSCFRVGG